MSNLKLRITIALDDNVSNNRLSMNNNNNIAVSHYNRIIASEIRSATTNEELKEIIKIEISRAMEFARKDLMNKIILPLTTDIQTQEKIHKEALENLFPNIRIKLYHSDGKFRLYGFSGKEGPYISSNISHPLDPHEGYLTTKYNNMYSKLSDGTWTYAYQTGGYYKGIAELVSAPVDETVIEQYFKAAGVGYEIKTETLLPLPEVKPYEPEEDEGY